MQKNTGRIRTLLAQRQQLQEQLIQISQIDSIILVQLQLESNKSNIQLRKERLQKALNRILKLKKITSTNELSSLLYQANEVLRKVEEIEQLNLVDELASPSGQLSSPKTSSKQIAFNRLGLHK